MIAVIVIIVLLIVVMFFALCKISGDCSRAEEKQYIEEMADLETKKENLDEPRD